LLSKTQAALLICLIKAKGRPTNLHLISKATKVPLETIKTSFKKLKELDIITRTHKIPGRKLQGVIVYTADNKNLTYNNNDLPYLEEVSRIDKKDILLYNTPSFNPSFNPSINLSFNPTIDDDINTKENHHLPEEIMILIENFADFYPTLHQAGFSSEMVYEVALSWLHQNISLEYLQTSLERAEWDAEKNPEKFRKNPTGYVRTALMKGIYSPPPGFRSRERIALEEELQHQKKEAEEIKKLQKEIQEQKYIQWWMSLPDDEKKSIDEKYRRLTRGDKDQVEMARKDHFLNKILGE